MDLRAWLPAIRYFVSQVYAAWYLAGQPDLRLSSWFRTPEQNQTVGGRPQSLHLVALAIDVVGSGAALDAFAAACRQRGLWVVIEVDHLHVQLWPPGTGPRIV